LAVPAIRGRAALPRPAVRSAFDAVAAPSAPRELGNRVGLSLAQTAYDGGRRHARTEAARAQYDAAIADYRQTTLTAFQEVEDNLAALSILEREAQQQDEAVDSAKNNLRLFTDRYVGGRDNYLQVITAQTAYLDNERNQVEIRRRRMDATVLLVKALGGGWTVAALPKLDEHTHSSTEDLSPGL
jgi:outer membrane protein TolC